MHPSPLPSPLSTVAFTVSAAEEMGTTRGRMRAGDLDNSVWGIRRAKSLPATLATRCEMLALRIPDAHFSHSTAALLLKAPLPLRLERDIRLHVSRSAPARAPHAAGIIGDRLSLCADDVTVTRGIAHTSAARTWCDLGSMLSLTDLVAVGDYFLHWRLPLATADELDRCVARLSGHRGAKLLRAALALLNDRAESRPESTLRVILSLAGLPAPRINHVIVETESGSDMRPDFTFDNYMVLLEYQGDYHRTRAQWRKDMTRRSRLEAKGWYVMEINADDVKNPAELTARIRTVLRSHGWHG